MRFGVRPLGVPISSFAPFAIGALAILLALTSPGVPSAHAAPPTDESLQVVVGPGAKSRDPIAIPDPQCFGASKAICGELGTALRRDMLLSFFFKVLAPRSFLAAPDEPVAAPVWPSWNNVGARYLIKGKLTGPAPYRLELRLFNVTSESELVVHKNVATGLSADDLRGAVHRFANGVLKSITGTAGVFDTRIAFAQRTARGIKAIGVMDMDGARRGLAVANGSINMLPAWGGGGLMHTSFLGGKPDLYRGKKRFSKDNGHYRKVAVSRDGSKVVASISYGGQSDLFLMSPDGTVLRNLTDSPSDEVSPTFSPDGSKIAFVSSASGGPQIYMMSLSGGGGRRLTMAGGYNYAPDWGPNGRIAFAAMTDGNSDIFTVTEGGVIERLTQDQGSNKDPTWSPDGRYIAFASRRDGGSGIWLMSADGRYQLQVAKGGGVGNLAWQR